MAVEQRRREVHGKPLGRNHLFRSDDGFPICYHRLQGYVAQSLASRRGETVTGDNKFTGTEFSFSFHLNTKSLFDGHFVLSFVKTELKIAARVKIPSTTEVRK